MLFFVFLFATFTSQSKPNNVVKKFVFFTIALVLSWSYSLNAQCDSTLPITENFNDSNTVDVCWNITDGDGDSNNWY